MAVYLALWPCVAINDKVAIYCGRIEAVSWPNSGRRVNSGRMAYSGRSWLPVSGLLVATKLSLAGIKLVRRRLMTTFEVSFISPSLACRELQKPYHGRIVAI